MTKTRLFIIIAASLLTVAVASITIVATLKSNQSTTQTVYDPFTGKNVPTTNDGEPPVLGDPLGFEFVDAEDLTSYFNGDKIAYIKKMFGSYVIYNVDKQVYRAKILPNSIKVPGDGTVTFSLALDKPNSGTYVVRIVQVPQQLEFESFTITNPKGSVYTVPQG